LFIDIYCSAQLFYYTLYLKTEISIVYVYWGNLHTYVHRGPTFGPRVTATAGPKLA